MTAAIQLQRRSILKQQCLVPEVNLPHLRSLENSISPQRAWHILQPMQTSVAPAPSQRSSSFAGMLAAFTEPEKKFPPARDEDGIADDIVTLSYEHALRSHARYLPEENAADASAQQLAAPYPTPKSPVLRVESSARRAAVARVAIPNSSALIENNLKRASITIRLSQSDCAQLHQRAAEAGLSVSAYLRSCTLEVETLRAQVKETLLQLRSATSGPVNSSPVTSSRINNNRPDSNTRCLWSRLQAMLRWPAKARALPA